MERVVMTNCFEGHGLHIDGMVFVSSIGRRTACQR